jgi:catechol 2,3-dioxygenase-like lactoylglutathione lyase family enzyme
MTEPVSTLRGLEHVAFTVPNIEQAIRFFVDVLGCEHFYDIGPFEDPEGDWFAVNLDVDARARIPRADQVQRMPQMSDWGGMHLAFYVDDMRQSLAELEQHGVRILGGAKDGLGLEAGDGSSFAHFLSPWGMLLELVSFPHGKHYMAGRDRLLWTPLNPSA